MKRLTFLHIISAAAVMILTAGPLHAQKYPERREIRAGNKEFAAGDFPHSEVAYRRALEKNPDSYEAQFNLANALYKQERYNESAQIFQRLARDTTHADNIAQCHYNAGNALFKQRKLQESLDAYKNSLRKDPTDMDAKFNLAYVKKMLEEQQGGGGGDDDKQQDKNKDKNKDQGDGKQDKEDQDKDKGGDDDKSGQDKQDEQGEQDKQDEQQNQQGQQGMTQAEAQQMLDAMQAQEDRTQDKMDEQKKGVAVRHSGRNW